MLIFVRDIPVSIVRFSKATKASKIINLREREVSFDEIAGNTVVRNAEPQYALNFISFLQEKGNPQLKSVEFCLKDEKEFKAHLKNTQGFIKAAGGIVENIKGEILLIKRLGKWDLPKGKAEKDEISKLTAVREVEEECGVKVKLKHKIANTWHTYRQNGRLAIKRTKWYTMELLSDKNMKPQKEEDIEELRWANINDLGFVEKNSYQSILHVLEEYKNHKTGNLEIEFLKQKKKQADKIKELTSQ